MGYHYEITRNKKDKRNRIAGIIILLLTIIIFFGSAYIIKVELFIKN